MRRVLLFLLVGPLFLGAGSSAIGGKSAALPSPFAGDGLGVRGGRENFPRPQGEGLGVRDGKSSEFLNGKDLAGWEGLIDDYWSYKHGAIIGITPAGLKFNTFLCSKEKYADFELGFEVWLAGKSGNSGVQIRSELFDEKHFAVKGPQCDMGQEYWGSLYGEHFGGMMKQAPKDVVTKALKENEFNHYHIKCVGKHVTIKLNGHTTVDDDFPKMPESGIIAWQLHAGAPMMVIFRKIEFKELPKGK